jgi:hypothetical protein
MFEISPETVKVIRFVFNSLLQIGGLFLGGMIIALPLMLGSACASTEEE